jgi:arylformamidase
MKIYDISLAIYDGMPVYPGDPEVNLEPVSSIEEGAGSNLTLLRCSTHTGTHIDAPRHFLEEGVPVDRLPLDLLIGPVSVVEVQGNPDITRETLAALPLRHPSRLLLKANPSPPGAVFDTGYTSVSEDAARYLVERGVVLVGIDALSIERLNGTGNVHRVLLEQGVAILEGVDLHAVPPGEYELICLPLRIRGGDGAPARAVLRRLHEREGSGFDSHSSRWPLS